MEQQLYLVNGMCVYDVCVCVFVNYSSFEHESP